MDNVFQRPMHDEVPLLITLKAYELNKMAYALELAKFTSRPLSSVNAVRIISSCLLESDEAKAYYGTRR